jgi:hypothetical protein
MHAGWVKAITRRLHGTWRDYFDDGPSTGYVTHTMSETKRWDDELRPSDWAFITTSGLGLGLE